MTYEEQYRKEICKDPTYIYNVDSFRNFLKRKHLQGMFAEDMNNYEEIDQYLMAVDYCIPVIMVKYFKKMGFVPEYIIRR